MALNSKQNKGIKNDLEIVEYLDNFVIPKCIEDNIKVVGVTTLFNSVSKDYLACDVAKLFADNGNNTLLIDMDTSFGTIKDILRIDDKQDKTIHEIKNIKDIKNNVINCGTRIDVLPTIFKDRNMINIFEYILPDLKDMYERIIINCKDINDKNDIKKIEKNVDGILLAKDNSKLSLRERLVSNSLRTKIKKPVVGEVAIDKLKIINEKPISGNANIAFTINSDLVIKDASQKKVSKTKTAKKTTKTKGVKKTVKKVTKKKVRGSK